MELYERIADRKKSFDALLTRAPDVLNQLRQDCDIELTYTSNAIEGNMLTHRQTAALIKHGITAGGKTINDHLEAEDHYAALQWMREQAETDVTLGEGTVTELHRRVVRRSNPDIAGNYSEYHRRIKGSHVIFPNPAKVPYMMDELGQALAGTQFTPEAAFDAHYRLTAIHPFSDGNGRTARLLMNLILIRGGYPPVAVRPKDRATYIDALETASLKDDLAPFQQLLHERLDATLGEYMRQIEALAAI